MPNEIKLMGLIEPDRQILIFSVMTVQTLMKFPWTIRTGRMGAVCFLILAAHVCPLNMWCAKV